MIGFKESGRRSSYALGFSRAPRVFVSILLVVMLVLSTFPASSLGEVHAETYATITVTATAMYDYAYEILDYVNEERVANGLNELKMDTNLLEAAMQRAAESVVTGEAYSNSELSSSETLAHYRPDGTRCFTVSERAYGENIAMGQTSTFAVMFGSSRDIDPNNEDDMDHSSWMRSSGHRSNILEPSYKSVGIGVVYYNGLYHYYWSQEFGKVNAIVPTPRYDQVERTFSVNLSLNVYNRLVASNKLNGETLGTSNAGSPYNSGDGVDGWRENNGRWWYMYQGRYIRNTWLGSTSGSWYFFDSEGYMVTGWRKVGPNYYYFSPGGEMASNEWRDGYWLSANGAWLYEGYGSWHQGSGGWWFGDSTGWFACNQWQKINGKWYYFDGNGYMVTNQTIDGYRLGADGTLQ